MPAKTPRTRTASWVVILGSLATGVLSVVGPFKSAKIARTWAQAMHPNANYVTFRIYPASIYSPTPLTEEPPDGN